MLGGADGSDARPPAGEPAPHTSICYAEISLQYRFIFLRNPKTGSTSLHHALFDSSSRHCRHAAVLAPEVRPPANNIRILVQEGGTLLCCDRDLPLTAV